MSKRQNRNSTTGIVILSIGFICAMCCIGTAFINLIDISSISSNPVSTSPQIIPLDTVIFQTVSAAQAQTSAASTPPSMPSLLPTEVLASTMTVEATATLFIFELQTNVAQPTSYIFETNTPFVLTIVPNTPIGENCNSYYPDVCINDNPRLSCEELRKKGISHFRALPPDPLEYDKDNDGIGCE